MSNLVWSVKNGDLNQVKSIVEQGADVNAMSDGRCPLHFAADYGQVDVLKYLISKGAKVNATDKYGITPLLSAVFEGHENCAEALIANGADKKLKHDGKTYYEYAETDTMKSLLK